MFSEASQTEWREPFDFPTSISGFSKLMVSNPAFPSRMHLAFRNASWTTVVRPKIFSGHGSQEINIGVGGFWSSVKNLQTALSNLNYKGDIGWAGFESVYRKKKLPIAINVQFKTVACMHTVTYIRRTPGVGPFRFSVI